MNKYIIILIILIIILLKRTLSETFENNIKVTIIILNYNRPHNIKKLVPILAEYNNVGEIIISHGKKETEILINHPKVINETCLRNTYYAMNRFFLAEKASNELILYLDDDILITEQNLELLINNAVKYGYNNLYGQTVRICSNKEYSLDLLNLINLNFFQNKEILFNNNNKIILTNIAMIGKETSIKVLDLMKKNTILFNKVIENKGNGEDILFSKTLINNNIGKNIYVPINYKQLDCSNGYSSKDDHFIKRIELCKLF
jgi:hypothetical protein